MKRTSKRMPSATPPDLTESFEDIKPKRVRFLWWPWIPLGKLTILEGEPDVGKSTMTLEWAGFTTRGEPFPATTIKGAPDSRTMRHFPPSNVLLVGMEDDAADTIVPRLDANGADRGRIFRMRVKRDEDGLPIPWVVPDDVDNLRDSILEMGAILVVIDPITAFMSERIRTGSDTSNRKALMYLAEVAAETGAAIVLVRHLNKASGMDAKSRGGGSIAFTALARSVMVAGREPVDAECEDETQHSRYVLASTKGNLAPEPDSLGYSLEPAPSNADVAVIFWHGPVAVSADQVVGADRAQTDARKRAPDRDEAMRVLLEILADGPLPSKEAVKQVRDETGVSEKTVHAARQHAKVESKRVYGEKGTVAYWEWVLPTTARHK